MIKQLKLEVSPEVYILIREKQSELIKKTRQPIKLKDITNIALQSIINNINIESDKDGWILTSTIHELKIPKELPKHNIFGIEGAISPTLNGLLKEECCDGCGKIFDKKVDGNLINQCFEDKESKLLCNECLKNHIHNPNKELL